MQTFLPYSNFYESLVCLDPKRLNKQKIEAYQILNVLEGKTNGWKNHPAVLQWKGYEEALKCYLNTAIDVCINHLHYANSIAPRAVHAALIVRPPWLGYEPYHSSHRAALLAKSFDWYKQYGWKEKPEINYIWPSKMPLICRKENT